MQMQPVTRYPLSTTGRASSGALVLAGWIILATAGCGDPAFLPTQPTTDEPKDSDPTVVEVRYEAVLLEPMGGDRSAAWAINDAGVAAGWTDASGGRALRWTDPDTPEDVLGRRSGVRGINNSADIVGWAENDFGDQVGYVFSGGVGTNLRSLEEWSRGIAYSINEAGTIVGMSTDTEEWPHRAGPVIWERGADGSYGVPTHLGLSNINGRPRLNNRGDVVFTAFGDRHFPLIWHVQPDGGYGEPFLLGRPRPGTYIANDMNDAGVVVGYRWTGVIEVAVVWLPDDYPNPVELGVAGQAWGINEHNQVVGITGGDWPTFGRVDRRPALWTVAMDGSFTGPQDIGTPADHESGGARAINDAGWIVGTTWGPGEIRATLWRPVD